jgi:osmoprotectant transport system substrate-binding protein
MMRWTCLLLALLLTACTVGGGGVEPGEEQIEPIRVGAGPDPETALLAHTLVALLRRAGIGAEVVAFSEARDARRALEQGDVELRPAYTGEAWLETLGRPDPPGDPEASYLAVAEQDAGRDISWLPPEFGDTPDEPPANATFAFVVADRVAADAELITVSQLATRLAERPDALLCVDDEFASRPDGLRAVLAAYSVRSDQPVLAANPQDAVLGVAAGDCLAGLTTATDGAAWQAGLRPLTDDLRVFPAFVPLPQLRDDTTEFDTVRVAIEPLPSQLSTTLLAAANGRIVAGEPLEQVADELATELLIRADRPVEPAAS